MKQLLGSLSLLSLALVGCTRGKPNPPAAAGTAAVRMNDEVITVQEIDRRIAADLFELRSSALRAVLIDRLLEREAKRRGVSLAQLRQEEVETKTPMPSEAEGTTALAQWVDAGRIKPDEAARMTPAQIADRLRSMRMRDAEETFFDRLMKESAVQVNFSALGKPDLQLAADGPTLGPKDAPIQIVEFADLSVSFTSIWQRTLEQLIEKHPGRLAVRFKQKPSAPDTAGAKLAEAALCASDQNRYWEFRKALLAGKGAPTAESLRPAAAVAKLDIAAFEQCVASGHKKVTVASNAREAARNRLEGDPVLSVNGIILSGAQDLATIERLLRLDSGVL